jgi:ribulose 1,5-bisphosphate synthetase/thiazole synthase
MQGVGFAERDLPILHSCDAAIIDGSLAGIAVALALSRAGYRVAVVEQRTYLGREITATLRPWLSTRPTTLPEPLAGCLAACGRSVPGGEVALHLDALKRGLEDLLLEVGIWLLYASVPVGLVTGEGRIEGVAIGNKSGRQAVACSLLVDTSTTALLARLAGVDVAPPRGRRARFSRTIEFDGLAAAPPDVIAVPSWLGVADDRLLVHQGYREPTHALVEFELPLPTDVDDATDITARELAARDASIDIAAWLTRTVPAFAGARLAALSFESLGPNAGPMAGECPAWAAHLSDVTWTVEIAEPWPLAFLAGPIAGLWCLNDAARVTAEQRTLLRDPLAASTLGARLGQALVDHWPTRAFHAPTTEGSQRQADDRGTTDDPSPRLRVAEPVQPQRGRAYPTCHVLAQPLPVRCHADVLVAGGGTSGAVAAISAAEASARTCLVDMNPALGGTGTLGGVHSYWFGRRVGFAARVISWVNDVHRRLGYPDFHGEVPAWNMEAKAHALAKAARAAGVQILLSSPAIAAIVQGDAVRGLVAATPTGPVALLAHAVVDATGDGDIAAFAGAPFTYGATRDRAVMWYSLAQFAAPASTRNNFASTVDVGKPRDYTRALLAGRRRGQPQDHDHGIYLAPRESRHVHGDVMLTLNDQLLHRCWPDVVCIAFSNNDIKGQIGSDWLRAGLIPPNLEIEIPYHALLPTGLEGILVVGKALSATHDALPSIRMQADLENLGGAAGLAAAITARGRLPLRALDIAALQAHLVEVGALPPTVCDRLLIRYVYTNEQLRTLANLMPADRPLHAYSDMEMDAVYRERIPLVDLCCAGPQAVPILEQAYRDASGIRRLRLAQALALLGCGTGVPTLADAILDQLASGQLPPRRSQIRHANRFAPDQGAMPEGAYLLYTLGMARDLGALSVWQRIVDLTASVRPEEICRQESGVFHYVDAVCLGTERLADPAAISLLQQLHGYPLFRGQRLTSGFQADHLPERVAYLEVAIGRALAHCASPDGLLILIDYLEDVRAVLAESAHDALIAVAGCDLGKDIAAWYAWLEDVGENLRPTPWLTTPEPALAWGQPILVAAQ